MGLAGGCNNDFRAAGGGHFLGDFGSDLVAACSDRWSDPDPQTLGSLGYLSQSGWNDASGKTSPPGMDDRQVAISCYHYRQAIGSRDGKSETGLRSDQAITLTAGARRGRADHGGMSLLQPRQPRSASHGDCLQGDLALLVRSPTDKPNRGRGGVDRPHSKPGVSRGRVDEWRYHERICGGAVRQPMCRRF